MKLFDAKKIIHTLSLIVVAFIVIEEWGVDKIMPKLKKKNRKIIILAKKHEDVMRILKWLLSLWKGLETETKNVGEINRN